MYLNIGIFLFNFKFYQFFWWIKFIFCDRFLLHYISIYCCAALHKWNISNTNLICIHYIFLKYLKVSLPKIYFMLTWIFIVRTLFLICWMFSSSYQYILLHFKPSTISLFSFQGDEEAPRLCFPLAVLPFFCSFNKFKISAWKLQHTSHTKYLYVLPLFYFLLEVKNVLTGNRCREQKTTCNPSHVVLRGMKCWDCLLLIFFFIFSSVSLANSVPLLTIYVVVYMDL